MMNGVRRWMAVMVGLMAWLWIAILMPAHSPEPSGFGVLVPFALLIGYETVRRKRSIFISDDHDDFDAEVRELFASERYNR